MASTNINLNMTSVENREYRLGTIIGWDGKAKKHGGCASKGAGCKLCELHSPLNQETMCSNAIVQCQVGNLTDCALIDHSPIGCSGENSKFNLSMHVGLKRRGKPLQNTLNISTNLKEQDMVFGASEKLDYLQRISRGHTYRRKILYRQSAGFRKFKQFIVFIH